MYALAQMNWGQSLLALLLIFICLLLMVVILLQKGRGGGLAGAFGGSGGSSAFGAKTGDVFTWITVIVATVFVLLAVVANFAFDQSAKPVSTVKTEEPTGSDTATDDAADAGGSINLATPVGQDAQGDDAPALPIKVVPLGGSPPDSALGEGSGEVVPDSGAAQQPQDQPTEAKPEGDPDKP